MDTTIPKILICFSLILIGYSGCKKPDNTTYPIKIMSFNIWCGGGNSVEATGEVFVKSNADIIGIQEAERDGKNIAVHLADSLHWYSYDFGDGQTIVSKYPIVDTSDNKYGVKIQINDKQFVWMFNIHLGHCPYQPYQLNGIEYCGAPILSSASDAVNSALSTRKGDVYAVADDILEVSKENYPVFLTGDFNEPSHLDWTEKATQAGLCIMPVEWPSSKIITDYAKMKDSYRICYPGEVEKTGHTWTTLPETEAYNEVLDRIDFVFFCGEKVEVVKSQVVGERSAASDVIFDNYPSDHRAVLTSFTLR